MKPFASFNYDDAKELFAPQRKSTGTVSEKRRPPSAISATQFYEGDHWQNSDGFIGQLPPASVPGAAQITLDIKKRFVCENAVQEVVETHRDGLLGREPLWSFLQETAPGSEKKKEPDKATQEVLTPWWNEREALRDLQRSVEIVALEGIAVRRLFFPKGRSQQGKLTASNLNAALDFIYFETLHSDVAGVFTDPDTQKQIGVYLFDDKDEEGNVTASCAELSFLNDAGDTACKIVRDKGADEDFGPYKLGGRLLLFEMKRRALITEQVQSNQRALNLAHTMMVRNVNMAGARERTVTNAQPPKKPRRIQDSTNPALIREVLEPATHETGGGAVMYLMGYPIRNDKGDIVGYTNPNMNITDPAAVTVFRESIEEEKTAIYSQCHQRHILIAGDATASGVSRKQAEKGYQRSLKETKTVVDAAGRWQLETSLRLAAQITNQSNKYLALRADFNCLLDVGELEPDDLRVVLEMRKPGGPNNQPLISDETARNKAGFDDAAAELKRIEEEAPAQPITPPVDPNQPPKDKTADGSPLIQ